MEKKSKGKKNRSLTKLKTSTGLVTLKYNSSFCDKFFQRSKMASVVDQPSYYDARTSELVYNVQRVPESNLEAFQTIIDLLLQLRASQDDQNIFVQNNTVLRESILKQLKSEVLRVSHKLTNKQIKNLEVVSSNNFDEDTLTDILNSFLKSSKKKLGEKTPEGEGIKLRKGLPKLILKENLSRYFKTINETKREEKDIRSISSKLTYKKFKDVQEKQEVEEKPSVEEKSKKDGSHFGLLKNPVLKDLIAKEIKTLKIPYEEYESEVTKTSSLLLPLIKLQSEVTKDEILKKTKSFVKKIVSRNLENVLTSENELVNRVISETKINELKENLERNYERYDYFTSKHQTDIRRIQTDIKKIQKITSKATDKNYILRSFNTIDLNTRSKIQKNIIKLVSGHELTNKFANISENFFQTYIQRKSTRHHSFINKVFENQLSRNINKNVIDRVNLKHRLINLEEKDIREINNNETTLENIKRKHVTQRNINKNLDTRKKEDIYKNHIEKHVSTNTVQKLREFIETFSKDRILRNRNILKESTAQVFLDKFIRNNEFINLLGKSVKNIRNFETLDIYKNISKNIELREKKNLLKNIHINRSFKNIREILDRSIQNNIISEERVNKLSHDKFNLKNNLINVTAKEIKAVNENEILSDEISKKYLTHEERHKNSESLITEKIQNHKLRTLSLTKSLEKINLLENHILENKFVKNADTIKEINKKFFIADKLEENSNLKFINNRIYKKSTELSDLKSDFVVNNFKEEITKNLYDKKTTLIKNILEKFERYNEFVKNIDISKEIKSSQSEKILSLSKIIKNTKNINLIKTPLVFSSLSTIIDSKLNLSSKKTPSVIKSFTEFIFKNQKVQGGRNFADDVYYDKSHIVYKQKEIPKEKVQEARKDEHLGEKKISERPEVSINKVRDYNPVKPLDEKAVDKRIRERTLDRNQIVSLIESYMKNINIDNISSTIIEKIEGQILMDKKRNGIF